MAVQTIFICTRCRVEERVTGSLKSDDAPATWAVGRIFLAPEPAARQVHLCPACAEDLAYFMAGAEED